MRRLGVLAVVVLMTACGGAEKSAFAGTWAGTKSIAPSSESSVPHMLVGISDDGHGALRLNGLAPARVTSATTFEALPVTFATIYGPGYMGPGNGTTTVTGGTGQLTGTNSLSITLDFSENDAGVVTTYQATYTLERSTSADTGTSL